ncbi:hypothetical protein FACS1894151_11250 [Spirochaetia bacterium]|nr:hypothetical protein FACS1894151_11250 [Spirochaetia bacterium]
MRKIVLSTVIFSIAFLLAGCQVYYYSTAKNNSSLTVNYLYYGSSETLAPSASKDYKMVWEDELKLASAVPAGTVLSVKLEKKGDDYQIVDADPIDLHVTNTMPFPVSVKAGGYIDYSGLMQIDILANTEITTAKIYTSTPEFYITSSYPATVEWKISGGIMYVVIK